MLARSFISRSSFPTSPWVWPCLPPPVPLHQCTVHLTGQCTRPVNEFRPQAGEGGFSQADSLHYREDRLLVRRDGCSSLPHTNHSLTTSPLPLFIPSPLGDRIIVEDIIFLRLLRCGHASGTRVKELQFQRNSITVVHHEQCVTFN